jgi:hypothetical protein
MPGWTFQRPSTRTQSNAYGPIITALGGAMPSCQVTVESVSLVAQHGPERAWAWEPLTRLPLAMGPAGIR